MSNKLALLTPKVFYIRGRFPLSYLFWFGLEFWFIFNYLSAQLESERNVGVKTEADALQNLC